MLLKEKELEYFKTAKNYINSNPSEYEKSLEELNKITLLLKNITIIHMKTLCLLMLTKYEDIIEFYYLNKNHIESIFNQNYNGGEEIEKNEIKKIISIAFFNSGMRQKAKKICPEIKDEYQIEKFELEIIQNKKDNINNIIINNNLVNDNQVLKSNRIDENNLLKNIKNNLDENIKNKKNQEKNKPEDNNNNSINLNTTKDLIPISENFVNDLFQNAIDNNKKKHLYNDLVEEENVEKEETKNDNDKNIENNEKATNEDKGKETETEIGGFVEKNSISSKSSNRTNIYNKLKEEIELNNNNIEKDDGLLITLEDRIKGDISIEKEKNENNKDNNDNNDNHNDNNKENDDNDIKKENENENDNNNKDKNNNDDNEKKEESSNRSKKSDKLKEIKGPLSKEKIPLVKNYTNDNINYNYKPDKESEVNEKKKENEKPEDIKEEEDVHEHEEKKEDEKKEDKDNEKKEDEKKEEQNIEEEKSDKKLNININIEKKEESENKEVKEDNNDINKNEDENNKEDKNENNKINDNNNNNNNNNNFIKKSFTDKRMNFLNKDIKRIYPKQNNNEKNNKLENQKDKNKRISIERVRTYKTYGYINPIEFTLNPEDGQFKPISPSSKNDKNENNSMANKNLDININDKKEDIKQDSNHEQNVNIDQNRALLRVEIDGEQIDLVQNENPSRKNSKYDNYINIDYTEFSNKKRKKMIDKFRDSALKNLDIKNKNQFPKSIKVNSFNLRGIKNNSPFNIKNIEKNKNISENDNDSQSNLQKTCFYKTSYFLDKFDSK